MDIQTPPTVIQPSTSEDRHTNQPQGTNQPGSRASAMVAIAAGIAGGVVGLIIVATLTIYMCDMSLQTGADTTAPLPEREIKDSQTTM